MTIAQDTERMSEWIAWMPMERKMMMKTWMTSDDADGNDYFFDFAFGSVG